MQKCEYYSSKDIQEILGISKQKAYEILHMFEQKGQLFRVGRVMRVKIKYFEEWLSRIDGEAKRAEVIGDKIDRLMKRQ